MKPSTAFATAKTKYLCAAGAVLLTVLAALSLFVGKYPLSLEKLIQGDEMQWKIFWTLRLSRTLMGVFGGFSLGVVGFIYQTVFRNPLASPDIIGVSSGASAGAAAGIVFLTGTAAVTVSAFLGRCYRCFWRWRCPVWIKAVETAPLCWQASPFMHWRRPH